MVDEELPGGSAARHSDVSRMCPEKVRKAKADELDKLISFGAFRAAPRREAEAELKQRGGRRISTRWEIGDTGGVVKARFVCREFATTPSYEFFAPTTSSATLRVIDVYALEERLPRFVFDASAAFLHVPEREFVVCDPPAEWKEQRAKAGHDSDELWIMLRTLYGRRPAAQAWTEWLASDLCGRCGLERDVGVPTFFRWPGRSLRLEVHMDDGHGCGKEADIAEFLETLGGNVLVKTAGPFAAGSSYSFLGRERAVLEDAVVIRPARKHTDGILKELGLESAKGVQTPAVAETTPEPEDVAPLGAEDHARYRRCVGLALYLAPDRPDVVYVVKELSRHVSAPLVVHMAMLRRLARYLAATVDYGTVLRRSGVRELSVTTDANWAGCKRTRKSTTCYCVHVGGSVVAFGSRTQTTLAMSSGEAEYYGAVTGAAEALFLRGVLAFLGWAAAPVRVLGDSSAAIGVACRLGAGRLRTIDLRTLWLQQKTASGDIKMEKVPGQKNVADLGTKILAGPRLRMLSRLAGLCVCLRGRMPESIA